MVRILSFFIAVFLMPALAMAATSRTGLRTSTTARAAQNTASPAAAYNYNYMYPYLNNQMRTDLNPGTTPAQSSNPISVITKTEKLSAPRRVVARSGTKTSAQRRATTTRAAAPVQASANNTATARAATPTGATKSDSRRVVARRGTTTTTVRSARGDSSYLSQTAAHTSTSDYYNSTAESLPSARCLADYTECMNAYCVRENTAYNRCYCSAKLAQIDAKYKPDIENLITQIIQLRNKNIWSDEEMNQYWMNTIGKYTGSNSWVNLENALNINWANTESRVRGQQAFATGHDFCVQHLRGCFYMASNMRDAYRSEVARDCDAYEAGLQKIKTVAESIVENYND